MHKQEVTLSYNRLCYLTTFEIYSKMKI